jgi:hypothetical protein
VLAVLRATLVLRFAVDATDPGLNEPPEWYLNELKLRRAEAVRAGHENRSGADPASRRGSVLGSAMALVRGNLTALTRPPLFGSPLWVLLSAPSRCLSARADPELGVPLQIMHIVTFLEERDHLLTPHLFVDKGAPVECRLLREAMEAERADILLSTGVAGPLAAASVLLEWYARSALTFILFFMTPRVTSTATATPTSQHNLHHS